MVCTRGASGNRAGLAMSVCPFTLYHSFLGNYCVAPRAGDSHQCRPQASPRFRQISVRNATRACVVLTQALVVVRVVKMGATGLEPVTPSVSSKGSLDASGNPQGVTASPPGA